MRSKIIVVILVVVGIAASIFAFNFFTAYGKICGGIAANLPQNQCPFPLQCRTLYRMPDSPGACKL